MARNSQKSLQFFTLKSMPRKSKKSPYVCFVCGAEAEALQYPEGQVEQYTITLDNWDSEKSRNHDEVIVCQKHFLQIKHILMASRKHKSLNSKK